MNASSEKHEFALHYPALSASVRHDSLTVSDTDTIHRITHVLRMSEGDSLILFDELHHGKAIIRSITKKQIVVFINALQFNQAPQPTITFLLPVLKREHLHDLVYSLAEVGVNEIQLVATAKVQRAWGKDQELEKLQKIVIAACEQSKQFSVPIIRAPVSLEKVVADIDASACKLYADWQGARAVDVMQSLLLKSYEHLVLMIGPEGDLTGDEKEFLKKQNFAFCALTPTILRSVQAGALFTGMIRSLVQRSA